MQNEEKTVAKEANLNISGKYEDYSRFENLGNT